MLAIRTILHPTDFSKHSAHAFAMACALARTYGARLVLLHIVPPQSPHTGGGDAATLRRAERIEQDLRSYRHEMAARLEQLAVPPELSGNVEREIKEGPVASVILREAYERPCQIIVLGTHGLSGRARTLMGSVAEEVSQKASCPVVTVQVPPEVPPTIAEPHGRAATQTV